MMEGQGRYRTSKNSSLLSVLIIGGDRPGRMEGQGTGQSKNYSLLSVLIIRGDRLAGWKDRDRGVVMQ